MLRPYATLATRSVPRPIRAQIDLAAMRHNLAAARTRAAGRKVWAVVKANAYGHGIENAVRGFEAADGLALIDLNEAQRARAAGWAKPMLLLEGIFVPRDVSTCRELGLTVVVHHEDQVRMLETASAGDAVDVYIKLNTGMNRLGFVPDELPRVFERLARAPAVRIAGLSMHFANADRADPDTGPVSMNDQLQRFEAACRGFEVARCLSNSAALFLHPPIEEAWVRPGIALYGATPDGGHTACSWVCVRP